MRREAAMGVLASLSALAAFQPAGEWLERGRSAVAARNWQEAVAAFGKACAMSETDAAACYSFGRTLQMLDRFEEAVQPFDRALDIAGRAAGQAAAQSKIHRAAALNYIGLLRAEKAEAHFKEAVRTFPADSGDDDPRVDYGAFLVREGRAPEAVQMLERATKARPASPRAHAELGRALLDMGRAEAAAVSLERAARLESSDWNVHLLLGRAYRLLGRAEDSDRELKLGKKGWERQNRKGE